MFDAVADGLFVRADPFDLGETTFQGQGHTRFVALPGGGFVALWSGEDGFNNPGVFIQRFDNDGKSLGPSTILNSVLAGIQGSPAISVPSSGGFVVTWSEESAYPASFDIKAQIFDAAGGKVGGEFIANTTSEGFQTGSSVVTLADGKFFIAWEHAGYSGFDDIRGQLYAADGARIGGEVVLTDDLPGDKLDFSLTALAGGGFVVAWFQGGAERDIDIYGNTSPGTRAQVFDASGSKLGVAFPLNSYILGNQQDPVLAALPGGGFVGAWVDGGQGGIWLQEFDAAGHRIGAELKANSLPSRQSDPIIEVVSDRGFIVIWKDGNQTAENELGGLRGQLFSFSGEKIGAEFALTPGGLGAQNDADVIALHDGSLVVGWTQFGPPQWNEDVRAQILYTTIQGTALADNIVGDDNRDFISGGGGNDNIHGGAGNDTIDGGADADTLEGDQGHDTLFGGAGNDTLIGGAGNDNIDGGDGVDTSFYAGLFRSYTVHVTGASGTVAGGAEGGTDTLTSVERVRFQDGVFDFNVDGAAAQVTRLYDTVLQRGPDQVGLDLWVDILEDQGGTLKQIAAGFLNSAEFQAQTGNLSNAGYVDFLYENALGRAPDASGRAYWVDQLQSGAKDRADLLIGFSESQEHRDLTAELVGHGFFNTDDDYQAVALLYDTFAGRQPDAGGLIYWAEGIENGTFTLDQVADSFANSPEFRNLTNGMSNSELVNFMYQNTLDRAADADGLQYWTGRLDAGMDRGDLLLGFSQSYEHFNLLGAHVTSGIDYLS